MARRAARDASFENGLFRAGSNAGAARIRPRIAASS
jgi:hypothetical protein